MECTVFSILVAYSTCTFRRRKRSATAISKQQKEDTSQARVAGTQAATGCKAAASIAALAMQHGTSDAWLPTLCNSQQASQGLLHAQPLDPNFRHSSGSSDQSMSNSTSFAHNNLAVRADENTSFPACEQSAGYAVGTGCLHEPAPVTQQTMCPSLWSSDPVTATEGFATAPQDDPLQDVLSWQLPPVEESCRPPMSGFDQALAFMQAGGSYPQPAAASALPQQQQQPAQQLLAQSIMTPPIFSATLPNINASSAALGQMGINPGSRQALPSYHSMPAAIQQQQPYTASNAAMRVSVKLFNCTPAQLPSSLRESVTGWLGSTPADVEGYIRPGCVHLTAQATVPARSDAQPGSQGQSQPQPCQAQAADVAQVVNHLLASSKQDIWHKCTMMVQLGSQVAVVHKGTPLKVWNIPAHADSDAAQQEQQQSKAEKPACCILADTRPSRLPVLTSARPVCLTAGLGKEQAVAVLGGGLSQDCKVLCRAGGKHLEVQVLEATLPSREMQVQPLLCNMLATCWHLQLRLLSLLFHAQGNAW